MENTTLKITGMTCGHCVAAVKRTLDQIDGVQNTEVSLTPSEAKISFDPNKTNINTLINAITEEGYAAEQI
ncbi:heavy-metal-associated domain-containing protein [Neisseria sp. Ec49-e6-T10]|uniref:heavy-metal-associated domain-containing protein n=1 Tax=Neisseria sp. Ec49-e6-T10 TaxID=3140744 RepID=UPI003EBBCC30